MLQSELVRCQNVTVVNSTTTALWMRQYTSQPLSLHYGVPHFFLYSLIAICDYHLGNGYLTWNSSEELQQPQDSKKSHKYADIRSSGASTTLCTANLIRFWHTCLRSQGSMLNLVFQVWNSIWRQHRELEFRAPDLAKGYSWWEPSVIILRQ